MSTDPKPFLTGEEYLELERQAEAKGEYWDGRVYAMGGASRNHARIVSNLIGILYRDLRGSKCNIYSSDLRLHIPSTGLYTYPDVIATCGEEKYLDQQFDTLLNPLLIVEVLSDSTQDYDRGRKFESYRSIESLQEYLTVAQDKPLVEQWTRQPQGWFFREQRDPQAGVVLACFPTLELRLADVYENVTWGPPRT